MPFDDQIKYIGKYISWYLKQSESAFLDNQVLEQSDLLYHKINLSPYCRKYVTLGHDHIINVRNFENRELIFRLCQPSEDGSFNFSFDSKRMTFNDKFSISVWDLSGLKQLLQIKGKFSCCACSKNEYFLATAGLNDYCLEIYDSDLVKLFPEPLKVASKIIRSMDFSYDNTKICIGSLDCTIKIWSLQNRQLLNQILIESSPITKAIFSPKETHIIGGTQDAKIIIWDIINPDSKPKKILGHKSEIVNIICSPDQMRFVSISSSLNMFVWNFDKMEIVQEIIDKYSVTSISLIDNNTFVTSNFDNTFIYWSFETGKVIQDPELFYGEFDKDEFSAKKTKYAYNNDVIAKFHPSPKNMISYWKPSTGELIKKCTIKQDVSEISFMVFSLDGTLLALASEDNVIVYDVKTPDKVVLGPLKAGAKTFGDSEKMMLVKKNSLTVRVSVSSINDKKEKISHNISRLTFFANGALCAAEDSGSLTIWSDITSGNPKIQIKEHCHNSTITSVVLSANETLLATGSGYGIIRVWDYKDLENTKSINLEKYKVPVKCMIFMDKGNKLISGCSKGLILWKLKDLEHYLKFPTPEKANIQPKLLTLTEDEEFLITAYKNGEIIVWSFTGSSPRIIYFYETFDTRLLDVTIKKINDETLLISNSPNQMKMMQLWSIDAIQTFQIKNAKETTSDGKYIFSIINAEDYSSQNVKRTKTDEKIKKGSKIESWKIKVYDGFTGQSIFKDVAGHNSEINFLKVDPFDLTLLSGDKNGDIFLWDIKTGRIDKGPMKTQSEAKVGIFTDSGKVFAIGEGDGSLSVWNVESGIMKTRKKAHEAMILCMDYRIKDDIEFWATGGKDLKIVIWDAKLTLILFSYNEVFEDNILNVKFWGNTIFVAGEDYNKEQIKCWNIDKKDVEKKETLLTCKSMCFIKTCNKIMTYFHDTKKNLYYMMILDKEIIETKQAIIVENPISKEEGEAPLQSLWINKNDLMCIFDNRVIIYRYLFRNEDLFFKKMMNICNFCRNPENLRFESQFEEIVSGTQGTVFPFMYNFLQAIAYTDDSSDDSNLLDTVFDLLDSKRKKIVLDAFFEKDIHGRNIFDIVFYKKNGELLNTLIEYLVNNHNMEKEKHENEKNHAKLLEYFTVGKLNEMLDIFENDPGTMGSLLNYLFTKPVNYPTNFVYEALEYPILTVVNEYQLNSMKLEEILKKNIRKEKRKYVGKEVVEAKCLYVHELLDSSNPETMKFFKKISNYQPTDKLFDNDTLVKLLEYKWEAYGKKLFFEEAFYFLLYLIAFLVNSTYLLPIKLSDDEVNNTLTNSIYIPISLALDVLLFCYMVFNVYTEVKQFYYFTGKEYLESIWNHIDILLIFVSFPAIILDILGNFQAVHPDLLKCVNSLTIFFTFLRLISYARGIDGSAFMVRLIIEVIIDMRYFLLLVYIFIIGLGFCGYELQVSFAYSHFTAFNTFFTEMLGDTDLLDDLDPENYYVLYFFKVLASVILVITLLNLLISIIGETFGNVRENEKLTRVYERWNILTEIDVVLTIKEKNEKKFLLYLYNDSHERKEQALTENDADAIKNKTKEFVKSGEKIMKDLKSFNKEVIDSFKDESEWLQANFKKYIPTRP